ncbi:uncharacterized protein LOC131153582 isoform X1 [Malania oleifera]|uniref:uncharacterized protein LOC131153582 isoform X1 n=1 Tax=Malania oleifera TaxID=397392 RepID=UPI0025AE8C52|nr:uncharacterized protein LOC131153582 isoform X1 [Malania oleifera]
MLSGNCSCCTCTHPRLPHRHLLLSTSWKPLVSSPSLSAAQDLHKTKKQQKTIGISDATGGVRSLSVSGSWLSRLTLIPGASLSEASDNLGEVAGGGGGGGGDSGIAGGPNPVGAKGSGTTARGRRLLRVREEKRKREFDRLHNYPAWAKVLEDACKNDTELRAVLGDSIGNPQLMRKRVEERIRKKGRDFHKSKTGSILAFKVSFRDFNPIDSYIWFELLGSPSDRDVDFLGSVIQSWYVMGRLGAFNSSNLQLANSSMEYNPLYDAEGGFKVMPSSFHDISDVEFQDNWGRVWVDLGTSDFFAIDVLLNCLTVLSSEHLGIQQVVFGGRRMGDWEEGMTRAEYGYKYFKI